MTILPIIKKCPKCRKKYSWNPDVGKFSCPYCGGLGMPKESESSTIFSKKKTKDR